MRNRQFVPAAIVAFLSACPVARAQTPPPQVNPGIIQNDIERQRRELERREQPRKQQGPAVIGPQRAPAVNIPGGGPRFLLRKVTFDKSKFITPDELAAIASKYIGKQVDIAGLQNMVADINALYAQRGIVTAIATLPPQTATGGVIHIKLTEGRLQKTTVEGNQQTSKAYILQRINPPVGEVLDVPQLNRDVVWFNRTNDVQLRALLQPGTNFGLTALQLAVTEPPRNTLQLFADNEGVDSTGRGELGAFYKRHGLLGIDDRLTFYGVKSEGNLNGNVAYNLPVNPWGGRLGASYTQGKIKIVNGPFQSLQVTGTSDQAALNFGQPVLATENGLVQLNAAYTYGNSESDFSAVPVVMDRYAKLSGGFAATLTGADYSVSIAPLFNSVDWHDRILGGDRNFDTFTGSANALVKLPDHFSASMIGSWQYTSVRLLPGDQLFSIGGATTVRGYQANVAAGDKGYYYNIELHRDMSDILPGLDAYAFIDGGAVYSTFPPVTQLDSSGAGISWSPVPAVTLETSFGVPWRFDVPNQPRAVFYARVIFRPLSLL